MIGFFDRFYQAVIAVLMVSLVVAVGFGVFKHRQSHGYKIELENATLKCEQQKSKIHEQYREEAARVQKAYQDALLKKQNQVNQLSADYEKAKAERQVVVEYQIKEIEKIVESPVYLNVCNDNHGVSNINELINSRRAK